MMAMGVPVVCTSVDSLRELMPSEEFGYPVAVQGPSGGRQLNSAALAAGIRAALGDPAEARRRGRAGRDRILGTFTNSRFAQGISALAESLLVGAGVVGTRR
jgi:glycosyltransferase involved in cell wall biosynthesis